MGYDPAVIPTWIARPEDIAAKKRDADAGDENLRKDVPNGVIVADATLLTPPPRPNIPVLEKEVPGGPSASERVASPNIAPPGNESRDLARADTIQRLREVGVTQIGDGRWMLTTSHPDGSFTMTPVDPGAVLNQIQSQIVRSPGGGGEFPGSDEISEMVMEELKVNANALFRKIALNPSVYQAHMYVTKVTDPLTGQPLFQGDIGDWLSWCSEYTLDNFYGAAPAMLTGRPSRYQQWKTQQTQGYGAPSVQGNVNMIQRRRTL